jgi:hypothetical protein
MLRIRNPHGGVQIVKRTIPITAFVVVALAGAFAATALATPSMTTSCQGCHSGTALVVTAIQTSNDGTTAGYNVTAPGCDYIAVFDGTTKYSQITSQTTAITVPAGKTYVLQAVKGPGMTSGFGFTSISPTATVVDVIATDTVDTTAAATVCDAATSYRGAAAVKLTATDNPEGWGVAYIYYQLDGPWTHLITVPANHRSYETIVAVPAPAIGSAKHTIKFWSQDNYGNVEPAKTETFTVNARTTMPMPISVTHTSVYRNHYVTISGSVATAGKTVVLYVKRPGASSWSVLKTLTASSAKKWSYTYKLTKHGNYYFKVHVGGEHEWLASWSVYKKVSVK